MSQQLWHCLEPRGKPQYFVRCNASTVYARPDEIANGYYRRAPYSSNFG